MRGCLLFLFGLVAASLLAAWAASLWPVPTFVVSTVLVGGFCSLIPLRTFWQHENKEAQRGRINWDAVVRGIISIGLLPYLVLWGLLCGSLLLEQLGANPGRPDHWLYPVGSQPSLLGVVCAGVCCVVGYAGGTALFWLLKLVTGKDYRMPSTDGKAALSRTGQTRDPDERPPTGPSAN